MDQKRSRTAKGGRHRCQPPCHRTSAFSIPRDRRGLVSAACSARAGKGMRASRRSSRPVASTPEGASAPGPRRPAPRLPGAATKPCWIPFPDHPETFGPLSRPSARGFRHRSRGASARSSAACLRLRFGLWLRIRSSEHPVLVSVRSPEGDLASSWPCKSLALLRFPSAPPPPYSYETVTESAGGKGRKRPESLLITWITGIRRAIRGPAVPIRAGPARTPRSRSRGRPRSSSAPSLAGPPPPASESRAPGIAADSQPPHRRQA